MSLSSLYRPSTSSSLNSAFAETTSCDGFTDEQSSSSSFASLAESDQDDELNTILCQVDLSDIRTSLLKRAFNRLEIETLQTAKVPRECTQIGGFSFFNYESKADFEADSKLIAKEKIHRILKDRDAIETVIPSAEDIIRGIKRSTGTGKGSTASSSSTATDEGSNGKQLRPSTQHLVSFHDQFTDTLDSLDDNNYHRLEVIQKSSSKPSSPQVQTPLKESPLKSTIHLQFQTSPISTPTTSSVVVSQISPQTADTSNENQSLESESEESGECDSQKIELFSDTIPAFYDALLFDAPIQATQYEETVQRTNRILAKNYEHLRKSNQISNTLLRFKGPSPLTTIDVPTALAIFNNHKPVPPPRAIPLKVIQSPLIPKPGLVNGNTYSKQVQQHPNLVASPAATLNETPTFRPASTHLPVFKPILKSTASTTNLPRFINTQKSATPQPSTVIKYNYILCPVSSDSSKQILINQQTQQASISTSSSVSSVPAKLIPSNSFKGSTALRPLSSSKIFFVNGTPRNVISAQRPFVGKNLFVLRKASVNSSTSTTLTSQNPDLISSQSQFHLVPYENSNSRQTLLQHTLQSASSASSPVNHQLLVQPN